jgi:hypothetical protein
MKVKTQKQVVKKVTAKDEYGFRKGTASSQAVKLNKTVKNREKIFS